MLSAQELTELIQKGESDRVEFTESLTNKDKFCEAICSFANDLPGYGLPGYLIVGVADDGSIRGDYITDQVLVDLGALKSMGNILPPPSITVNKLVVGDGAVAVVEVLPSDMPPVRYKGRVCVRVGPRRGFATEQEERLLTERRSVAHTSFDGRPCIGASLKDIDQIPLDNYKQLAIDPEILEHNHRDVLLQLAGLRLFDLSRNTPTNAAVLLFGESPRNFYPGAYVQYLRFPGTTNTDLPLDHAEVNGSLTTIMREMDLRLSVLVETRLERVTALQERNIFSYPSEALREFVVNALVHRDYQSTGPIRFTVFSDRVEIINPGGLFGGLSRSEFPARNLYRNPILAECMKVHGFCNRFGYGVVPAQRVLEENGSHRAEFEISDSFFAVTIRRRPGW